MQAQTLSLRSMCIDKIASDVYNYALDALPNDLKYLIWLNHITYECAEIDRKRTKDFYFKISKNNQLVLKMGFKKNGGEVENFIRRYLPHLNKAETGTT